MIKIAMTFKRKPGMSVQDFRAYSSDVHPLLLLSIPEAKLIKRFVISFAIDVPDWPEPNYDALVEAWFDSFDDIGAFYSSEDFRTKVDPDHGNFIDLSTTHRTLCEELVVV